MGLENIRGEILEVKAAMYAYEKVGLSMGAKKMKNIVQELEHERRHNEYVVEEWTLAGANQIVSIPDYSAVWLR